MGVPGAKTTEPKVSVEESGVHNEQTGWRTVAKGLQAIDVAAYVITAKAPQKETT